MSNRKPSFSWAKQIFLRPGRASEDENSEEERGKKLNPITMRLLPHTLPYGSTDDYCGVAVDSGEDRLTSDDTDEDDDSPKAKGKTSRKKKSTSFSLSSDDEVRKEAASSDCIDESCDSEDTDGTRTTARRIAFHGEKVSEEEQEASKENSDKNDEESKKLKRRISAGAILQRSGLSMAKRRELKEKERGREREKESVEAEKENERMENAEKEIDEKERKFPTSVQASEESEALYRMLTEMDEKEGELSYRNVIKTVASDGPMMETVTEVRLREVWTQTWIGECVLLFLFA